MVQFAFGREKEWVEEGKQKKFEQRFGVNAVKLFFVARILSLPPNVAMVILYTYMFWNVAIVISLSELLNFNSQWCDRFVISLFSHTIF